MSNIEELKKELLNQKQAIETAGGVVSVANQNPSPAEITAGIKTIEYNDVSVATATEADVAAGKTFYAGSPELKTGTASYDPDTIEGLFLTNLNEQTYNGKISYTIPHGVSRVRPYCFYSNGNMINVTFHSDITHIYDYAFYNCTKFTFDGFDNMTKLKQFSQYSFYNCQLQNFDFERFPESLEYIGSYCFANAVPEYSNIRLTSKLTYCGTSAFRCPTRQRMGSIDLTEYSLDSIAQSLLYYMAFNCDFILPFKTKTVNSTMNYNGCFKNIVFHTDLRTLGTNCFGANTTNPLSDYYLESVVFESETPPSTVGSDVFAIQNIENGFKIYVPDTAVEAYKAVTNLSKYVNCIYPMSQKE